MEKISPLNEKQLQLPIKIMTSGVRVLTPLSGGFSSAPKSDFFMAKRFFNTQRIEEDWYINLSCKHRELLRYCESKCDGAGIFIWNAKIASTYVGEKITDKDLGSLPISRLPNGKFFIHGFCYLQNGNLTRSCNAHTPIFKILEENQTDENELLGSLPTRLQGSLLGKEIEEEKERDKEREKAKLIYPFDSEEFMKVWEVLIKEPKWKKKTQTALQSCLKQLSNYPERDAIKMMENSIAGGWQGLFELKQDKNARNNGLQSLKRDSLTNLLG